MRRLVVATTLGWLAFGPAALGSPGYGELRRTDVGRGTHSEAGAITFGAGTDTVVYTFTLAPGATSGWHRHPGGVVVIVRSGVLTTYGLSHPPCVGQDVRPSETHFEKDASTAPWPHFVRNLGTQPVDSVVVAFNVPPGGSARTEADPPAECPDPTEVGPAMAPSDNAAAAAAASAAALAAHGTPPAAGPANLTTLPSTGRHSTPKLLALAAVACPLGVALITITRRKPN